MITTARITALLVAVPTFALLIAADRFTLDHLFFAPDLILCAALLFAAFTPRRRARRALILAFAFAAGVITTAVFSYVARGALDEGVPTVVAAAACIGFCLALAFMPAREAEREAA
jgi:peptidoglycan/LPS O-acetylase OafA/YrhL